MIDRAKILAMHGIARTIRLLEQLIGPAAVEVAANPVETQYLNDNVAGLVTNALNMWLDHAQGYTRELKGGANRWPGLANAWKQAALGLSDYGVEDPDGLLLAYLKAHDPDELGAFIYDVTSRRVVFDAGRGVVGRSTG